MVLTDEGRKRLVTITTRLGITQRQLAEIAGYKTHTYIGLLLRGERKNLEPEPALRIAAYFEEQVDTFFVPKTSGNTARQVSAERAA